MDTAAARSQPPPSMADLVRAISEEAMAPVASSPSPAVLQLPRPHPVSRLLVLVAVVLCALLAAMLFGLTRHVEHLLAAIRLQEQTRAHPALAPLPSDDRLLDPSAFAIAIANGDPGRLHRARGHALLAANRPQEAIVAFTEAARLHDAPLQPADRVALGEALLASGRIAEARQVVLAIDPTRLDDDLRGRANDCLGRVLLAERRVERQRRLEGAAR